jgi:dihydrofolate reductase
MGTVGIEMSMSLDGYITGPNPGPGNPLGDGGDAIFAWMMAPQPEVPKADGTRDQSAAYQEEIGSRIDATGAVIMGKRLWELIYGPNGWVAPDGTAFPWKVFVLTHEERAPETKGITEFTYINDGPMSALDQARAAVDGKNVAISGGNVCQQFLAAGLVDEITVHLVPVFLGGGVRLFDNLGPNAGMFGVASTHAGNGVTHLAFKRSQAD